jgi:predicted aconitase with swiveling domain
MSGSGASGTALVLDEPLSLWGGLDPATGRIVDRHHPQFGATVAGRILLAPAFRGSTSSVSVLAEAIRLRTAPLGLICPAPEPMAVVAGIVAGELYGSRFPVVVLDAAAYAAVRTGDRVTIGEDGRVGVG